MPGPRPSPTSARTRSSTPRSLPWASAWWSTSSRISGRSKPATTISGSRISSRSTISARTGGAAVAVRAGAVGGAGCWARARGAPVGGGVEDGRVAQLLDDAAETQVVGAEVVAPRGDAVRLVDDEQSRGGVADHVDDLGLGELLGGEEHEADRSVTEPLQDLAMVAGGEAGVQLGGAADLVAELLQPVDLVPLEGDQG